MTTTIDLTSLEAKCDPATRAEDMAVVRSIVECATMDRRNASFGLDARSPSTYTLRIRWGAGAFTEHDAQRLVDASTRITEVRYARRTIFVTFTRLGKDGVRVQYEPPAHASKKRAREIDWGPTVATDDDRTRLDAIVDAVYAMRDTMPLLRMWSEPIVPGRTGIDDAHGVETLVEPAATGDASESESVVAGSHNSSSSLVVGHALCFAGIDDVTGDFFAWLRRRFGPTVARVCVFVPPADADADADAVLVVNVRASNVDAARLGVEAAKTHSLRGDPLAQTRVRAKRARK